MTGGLLTLASTTTNDIYLTGSPQITFFKYVYRRYTNFAMEPIELNFENELKFGNESELIVPRIGDLIHKGYLHLHIPSFYVTRTEIGVDTFEYSYQDDPISTYNTVHNVYMRILTDIYKIIYNASHTINMTYINMINEVTQYVNTGTNKLDLDAYNNLMETELAKEELHLVDQRDEKLLIILNYRNSNIWEVLKNINITSLLAHAKSVIDGKVDLSSSIYQTEINRIIKNILFDTAKRCINVCQSVQLYFFNTGQKSNNKRNLDRASNVRFAWAKNLGYALIDYIDVYIGGHQIDHHVGIWFSIWHQLTYNNDQKKIVDKLIGNVPELTTFDTQIKPAYDIYLPLNFWFTKFNGSSFPLIAMQYNDVRITVKLRQFNDVAYIEKIYRATINGVSKILTAPLIDYLQNRVDDYTTTLVENIEEITTISLSDIWYNQGKELNGTIYFDYIYLEQTERKKFAQSGHEYLVDILQHRAWNTLYDTKLFIDLDFQNPSKELIWVVQKNINIYNKGSFGPCKLTDFSLNEKNPVIDATITFNNQIRVTKQEGKYFDTLLPLMFHQTSPAKGINMYSFSLYPRQFQPSGSANFSRLDGRIIINLEQDMLTYKLHEVYPFDEDIDFFLTIPNVEEFLESVDFDKINSYMESSEVQNNPILHEYYLGVISTLNDISSGATNQIQMLMYRYMFFKTNITLNVFSVSLNVLRLLSGYGGLAFSVI